MAWEASTDTWTTAVAFSVEGRETRKCRLNLYGDGDLPLRAALVLALSAPSPGELLGLASPQFEAEAATGTERANLRSDMEIELPREEY
jgi:hypothetical protein